MMPIHVQTRMVSPTAVAATRFTGAGAQLQPVPGIVPSLGLAAINIDAAGAYRLEQPLPGIAWSTETGKPLVGDFANVAFGKAGTFWFGARDAAGDAVVKASKLVPGEAPIALTVRGSFADPTVIADPIAVNGAPILWIADSRLGQPGVSVEGGGFAAGAGSSASLLSGLQQKGVTLKLWNAGDPTSPLPLRLSRIGFAKPLTTTLDWGVTDQRIGGHQALAFTLPGGVKRLQLALPPQTAVALISGKTRDDIWSGDAALAITQDTNADQMLVVSAAAAEAQLGIMATPLGVSQALGGGRLFKQYYAAEGVTRVKIVPSDAEMKAALAGGTMPTLRVAGAVTGTTLLNGDGTVLREASPKVYLLGSVDIAHGAGPVVAWLDGGDPLTSLGIAATATQVSKTASVDLKGEAQQIVFAVDAPKFLHLKTTTPVITQQKPADGAQTLRLFPNGADFSLYLPKGTTPLVLRSAGAGDLAGTAEATLIDIAPLNEGLGPKVRLAPGESRLYSFTVKDERDIGIGVRGGSDSAHCRVFDASGNTVGSGVVQMLHLKAGTYLLAVDAPSDGSAIEVQPALVGVAAPDGSPPDDVKRGYLELAGLKPKTNP
jgi:translocation and assembly module TamB